MLLLLLLVPLFVLWSEATRWGQAEIQAKLDKWEALGWYNFHLQAIMFACSRYLVAAVLVALGYPTLAALHKDTLTVPHASCCRPASKLFWVTLLLGQHWAGSVSASSPPSPPSLPPSPIRLQCWADQCASGCSALSIGSRNTAWGSPDHDSTVERIDTTNSFRPFGDVINFACEASAHFAIADGGNATFFTESDDGSAVYIDNSLIASADGYHQMEEASGAVSLVANRLYELRAFYFQGGGGSGWRLRWTLPGGSEDPLAFEARMAVVPPLLPLPPALPPSLPSPSHPPLPPPRAPALPAPPISSLYSLPRASATMSSVNRGGKFGEHASNCIDSKSTCIDGNSELNGCVSDPESNPWLRIDLGHTCEVAYVQIHNRPDDCGSRLGYFEVWSGTETTSMVPCASSGSGESADCLSSTVPGAGPLNIACTGSARYVEVRLPGIDRTLHLREVYVLASAALSTASPGWQTLVQPGEGNLQAAFNCGIIR